MRIALVADHNGIAYKQRLAALLRELGHEVDDRGGHDVDEVVDYPPLCADAVPGWSPPARVDRGVVIGGCGPGRGHRLQQGPRRAGRAVPRPVRRQHLAGQQRLQRPGAGRQGASPCELAEQLLQAWLDTPFKGGVHQRRVDQIAALERGELPG